MTHYYTLTELIKGTNDLKTTYHRTLLDASKDHTTFEHTEVLRANINATLELIEGKLEDIHIPISERSPASNRSKRGLINGLGSVIKFISGNLDSQDEERYNRIIKNLQNSQRDLQSQVNAQYSINEAIQRNFNKTIEIIAHNNKEMIEELKFLKTQNPHYKRLFDVRAILEHQQIAFDFLLNVIRDIESSIVACKSGILHPSVISPHLLYQELSKLSKFYKDKFPEFKNQNLWEIQSYLRVRCYVGVEEIIYFVDIPIMDPIQYIQYHLEPLPTKTNDEYVTIIPETKYFLGSHEQVIPLTQKCPRSGHAFLCPNYLLSPSKPECEIKFLSNSDTSKCKFIKLATETNQVKLLLEINRYLLFFPKGDVISIVQDDGTDTRTLFGIYLASPGNHNLKYRNQTLFAPTSELAGKPLVIGDVTIKLSENQQPDRVLNLKELNLDTLNLQDLRPITNSKLIDYVRPSVWTVILYVLIISLFLYTAYQYFRVIKSNNPNVSNQT